MKFTHMADCHIGGWRDPKLNELNSEAFKTAIDISVNEKVDFILIGGDLFNTALPGIDKLKDVVKKFKEVKDIGIPVYLIPGSHDFSPSGKTMLDVLEHAGLCINVVKGEILENRKLRLKFTVDEKTGAKITGLLGRRGMLEKSYYNELDREHLENEQGFKIFLFHTALDELKPKSMQNMEASPISLLPKGFEYYAGGHVHIVEKKDLPGYKNVVYPGPLFPNNFHELEELKGGGFYIYENGNIIRKDIVIKEILMVKLDCNYKTSQEISSEIMDYLTRNNLDSRIVMIRLFGKIEGKISDIDFRRMYEYAYEKNAYYIMRNTSSLSSREFEEIKIETTKNAEEDLINEHAGNNFEKAKEKHMIVQLMGILSSERKDGEKVYEYESRIAKDLESLY